MENEEAAPLVLAALKDKTTPACAHCIAKKIDLKAAQTEKILETLVGIGRAERIGKKVGKIVIGLGCWECGEDRVIYRYVLRARDLFNPKHWR